MSTLVSVIIPVFNRATLISVALDSVLEQTYPHFEIIVVNDGSTDNTADVLDAYKQKYSEKIVVLHQENTGQVIARNNGIQACRGELIAFLDSDDFWLPNKLDKQIPLFREGVGLVYSGINEIDEQGRMLKAVLPQPGMRGKIYHHLLIKNRMTGGSVVISRTALDKVGLFDSELKAAENWDLWIRIAKEFLVDYVDEPLMNYRRHCDNMSADSHFMDEATEQILQKHFPVVPSDPILRKSYDEAYINYYFNLGLYYFARAQYKKSRELLNKIQQHGTMTREIHLLLFRTYLGKHFNNFITSSKEQLKRTRFF